MGQTVVGACGLALGVLLAASTCASAAEAPIFAATPTWVKPAALPTSAPLDNPGAAVRTVLYDTQISFQPDGQATYTAYARKIETTRGLNNIGAVLIPWRPDIDTVTIHHVRVRRGDTTMDLLKGGKAVSILRRERGLEYLTLDGVLTATVQTEGVQVGDIIEVAYTTVSFDPTLGGHVQAVSSPAFPNAQAINFRAVLPNDRKLTWRAADLPADLKQSDGELLLHAVDPARVEPPRGAPGRFQMGARIELSDFASWNQVSALFHPLYEKARTLSPDSPLKAEIEKIRATSADPVAQASAALALVEDKVRYFAVTLEKGGYLPARADDTWSRRYGDCKAKTALLLALLDGLGIKAQAAAVSSGNGDGLNTRLPMPGAFDHVVVRAEVGGQVYWLDGTRTGDASIKALSTPNFAWALPLSDAGQGLEPIVQVVPEAPMSEVAETFDLSDGLNLYAKTHFVTTLRGEMAYNLRARLDRAATPALREEALKFTWTQLYPALKLTSNSMTVDPISGDLRLVADGQMFMPWFRRGETARATEIATSRVSVAAEFDHYPTPAMPRSAAEKPAKPPIRHADAPFSVYFPSYYVTETKVILPKGVAGLSLIGANVDRTLAGRALFRNASLTDGVITVRTSVRHLVPEISAADAKAAKTALNQIVADRVSIVAPEAMFSDQKRFDEVWAKTPVTKDDYVLRAAVLAARQMRKEALDATDRAIAMGEESAAVYGMRGKVLQEMGKFPEATAAFEKALAAPGINATQTAQMQLELARNESAQGHYKAALLKLDALIGARPNNAELLLLRGQTRRAATQEDGALADFDAALAAAPNNLGVYVAKAMLLANQKKPDAAAAVLTTMTTNNPLNFEAYGRAGEIYYRMGRFAEARAAAERSLILKPTAAAYIERARYRPLTEKTEALADLKAALALDSSIRNLGRAGQMQIELGDYEGAVRNLSAGTKLSDDMSFSTYLIAAYEASGQRALAAAQHAAVRAKAGKNPVALNSLCWAQATANVSLTRALADCDAALAIQRNAAFHDSRALVLLRLGRNADAVAAYDRALDLRPEQAASLFGRGLAKLAMGNEAEGKADLDAAKERQPTIMLEFSVYGLDAPAR